MFPPAYIQVSELPATQPRPDPGTVRIYAKADHSIYVMDALGNEIKLAGPGGGTLSGSLLFSPDNTFDIGAPSANRPRHIYAAGNVIAIGMLQISSRLLFTINSCSLWSGTGAPAAGTGNDGDYFFRSDTPAVANQRIYVKSAGAWQGIL